MPAQRVTASLTLYDIVMPADVKANVRARAMEGALRMRGQAVHLLAWEGDYVMVGNAPPLPKGLLLRWMGHAWRVKGPGSRQGSVILEGWGPTYLDSPKLGRYEDTLPRRRRAA